MGKGRFLMDMASLHPEINYVGVEMYDSVLLRALQKRERMEADGEKLDNLKFMCIDARILPDIFEKGEVQRIYLNFSDPWPKARHAKRRLTSREFLAQHNTMNSASSAKTYIKMQGQILEDDDCACLLVEAIAKKSQNIKWSTKVDGKNVQHRLIRRVSMDQFYAILTGEEDAFYKMCMALPEVINSVVNEEGGVEVPHDTVIDELRKVASLYGDENGELSMAMAVYMLGFNTYMGFGDKIRGELGEDKDGMLKRIYEYVKRFPVCDKEKK